MTVVRSFGLLRCSVIALSIVALACSALASPIVLTVCSDGLSTNVISTTGCSLSATAYSMTASATGGFPAFGSHATVTVSDYQAQASVESGTPFGPYAHGGFTDNLTVNGPAGSGFVQFVLDLTGSISFSGGIPVMTDPNVAESGTNNLLAMAFLDLTDYSADQDWSQVVIGSGSVTTPMVPVQFGTELSFRLVLGSSAQMIGGNFPAPASGTVDVNFGNTAHITSVRVFDANGAPISSGFSFASTSGYDYSLAAESAVPEPATWTLLVVGLLGFVGSRRR
ncbi:MAG: PEP-CTERM sorting domain-containing protein [Acidobacteriia bacterium]|nr:PEP-CTERM sorting domain-containing protein [Terriglobia bacterium]